MKKRTSKIRIEGCTLRHETDRLTVLGDVVVDITGNTIVNDTSMDNDEVRKRWEGENLNLTVTIEVKDD